MPIQATEARPEANFRTDLESDLALGMLRVVEAAAIAAAHTMGRWCPDLFASDGQSDRQHTLR
jgi:hypothetical protein